MTRAAPIAWGPVARGPGAWGPAAQRIGVTGVTAVYAALAATQLPPNEPLVTTYGAASATAQAAGLLAGLSLLVVGSLALWFGPSTVAGVMLLGAGVGWFAPDWAGWEGGPALVRGVATVMAPFLPVLLLGLLATMVGTLAARRIVVTSAVVVGVLAAVLVAVDDPFLDPLCWPTCSESALLVSSRPAAADVLGQLLAATWAALGVAAVAGATRRLVSASVVARRWEGALLGAIALVGVAEAVYGLASLTRVESAEDPVFAGIYLGRAAAWSVLALVSVWATSRHLIRRQALSRLAAELETASDPGSLAATLRSVTGDRALDVHYPVGRDGLHVTADGGSVAPATPERRTATPLRRGDRTVAVVMHDPAVLPVDALDEVLGPAARLALENERLAAERLARIHDVQESRRRIVATGDDARRRLERDRHDGAQQSLLALSYLLRLSRASALASGQAVAVTELDRGLRGVAGALDDLRDLAHGIHPAVLSEAGLAVALRSLAERSKVPLELDEVTTERFDPSVELAAYSVVREAAERADPVGAQPLAVRAGRLDGLLQVTVDGYRGDVPAEIADRVGALGGHLAPTATGVRVELPCG